MSFSYPYFTLATATIAVIGLGYVGLPLAVAFAEKSFPVVGIDVDSRKVTGMNRGEFRTCRMSRRHGWQVSG